MGSGEGQVVRSEPTGFLNYYSIVAAMPVPTTTVPEL